MNWIISKRTKNIENPGEIRNVAAKVSNVVGIFFNIFLFCIKFGAGTLVHSISIQADGINNLTDAGSNILSMLSFHFANKPADKEHPYGHQRLETLSAFLMAVMIGVLGIETGKESIAKIMHPEALDFRWITIAILLISIGVKLYMYIANSNLYKKYDSVLLHVVAIDARSDVWSTSAVLLSTVLSYYTHFNLDGYIGFGVSVLILYNALQLIKEAADTLIGKAPDPKIIHELEDKIQSYDIVLGTHDVMFYDYGPGEQFASAHVEVNANGDIVQIHECIDTIEKDVKEKMGIQLVLHMDPIILNDPIVVLYQKKLEVALSIIDKGWSYHDFRLIKKSENIKLLFDIVVPYEEKMSDEEIKQEIKENMHINKLVILDITIDHPLI